MGIIEWSQMFSFLKETIKMKMALHFLKFYKCSLTLEGLLT